jgi:hypothetical protein
MTTLNAQQIFEETGSVITTIKLNSNIYYFTTQEGLIYTYPGGNIFLDIRARVLFQLGSEIGLLGLAFHPTNPLKFYLWYSEEPNTPPPGYDHINRLEGWQIVNGVPQAQTVYLRLPNTFTNHNGLDNIYFDTQLNQLILATGDGGNSILAQQSNQLAGKIITININNSIWNTMQNTTPITTTNQLGVFASAINIASVGLRNPTRLDTKNNVKFLSVAGQSYREFAFCFTSIYGKNFGWRPLEGSVPTVVGTTVQFPSEVNYILGFNQQWGDIVSYANSAAVSIAPGVINGTAMTGIDIYPSNGSIVSLRSNIVFIDLSGQIFNASLISETNELLLKIPQLVKKITVNNLVGAYTTMFISPSGQLLVAHAIFNGNIPTARVSILT